MPGKKTSVFLAKRKKSKKKKIKPPKKLKPVRPAGDAVKKSINAVSSLSLHIDEILNTVFLGAPPVLRGYLNRADKEIKDLLNLLVTALKGTPGEDDAIKVSASLLLEELSDTDPELADKLAKTMES